MESFTLTYINKYPKETKRLLGIDHNHLQILIEQGKILHQRKCGYLGNNMK